MTELAAKASSAAAMDASVMAMCSQERKVRSDAKKVLGSRRCVGMGVVVWGQGWVVCCGCSCVVREVEIAISAAAAVLPAAPARRRSQRCCPPLPCCAALPQGVARDPVTREITNVAQST